MRPSVASSRTDLPAGSSAKSTGPIGLIPVIMTKTHKPPRTG